MRRPPERSGQATTGEIIGDLGGHRPGAWQAGGGGVHLFRLGPEHPRPAPTTVRRARPGPAGPAGGQRGRVGVDREVARKLAAYGLETGVFIVKLLFAELAANLVHYLIRQLTSHLLLDQRGVLLA